MEVVVIYSGFFFFARITVSIMKKDDRVTMTRRSAFLEAERTWELAVAESTVTFFFRKYYSSSNEEVSKNGR